MRNETKRRKENREEQNRKHTHPEDFSGSLQIKRSTRATTMGCQTEGYSNV
jgi:hypothetical protein